MSGEKNDLFTSLSSFLKLCQPSSLWLPYSQPAALLGRCTTATEHTEGKMGENPFSWSSFNSCYPCSRRSCKSPATATCGSCLHSLLEPGLDHYLLHGWERLFLHTSHVPVLLHPDNSPPALWFGYTPGASHFWEVPEQGWADYWLERGGESRGVPLSLCNMGWREKTI